jgi:hypothetical protein
MKNTKEIFNMLVDELTSHVDKIKFTTRTSLYFNEMLGDTSFLLAGLLGSLMNKNFDDWDDSKWFDDSLVTEVLLQTNKLKIYGVMIWGTSDTKEQWTEPFIFEFELPTEEVNYRDFTFMFSDLDNSAIPYEDFRVNRDYWTDYNRNWKYIIEHKSQNDLPQNLL